MNAISKLILLIISLTAFIVFICFVWLDILMIQFACLVIILCLNWGRFSMRQLIEEIRLFFPFVFIMMLVYILLGMIGFKPPVSDYRSLQSAIPHYLTQYPILAYWLHYGLTRCILFISTMLFIQFLLSFVTMDDLLTLPFSIHKKKVLILSQTLFSRAIGAVSDLEFHLGLLPRYQKKLNVKDWFRLKLTLALALILMLLRESRQKGELIDNRIKHCFNDNDA